MNRAALILSILRRLLGRLAGVNSYVSIKLLIQIMRGTGKMHKTFAVESVITS